MKTEEITLEQAALAWAQGKRVEVDYWKNENWTRIAKAGEEAYVGVYLPVVFCLKGFRFRLAPEPPAKKFRPWTPEEVPVGAQIRVKKNPPLSTRHMIVSSDDEGLDAGKHFHASLAWANERCEHSLDGAKTWLPCGVEVSE